VGLVIVDASDPLHPAIAGTVRIPDETSTVAVRGNRVYVAHQLGLTIVDATDIAHPVVLESMPLRRTVWPHLTADGDNVYIGQDNTDLLVIDASDPLRPKPIGILHFFPGWVEGLVVRNCTLYLAGITDGLVIAPAQERNDVLPVKDMAASASPSIL